MRRILFLFGILLFTSSCNNTSTQSVITKTPQQALDSIELPEEAFDSETVSLPVFVSGYNVKWSSSDETAISSEGVVYSVKESTVVTLTAELVKDEIILQKSFDVNVYRNALVEFSNFDEMYKVLSKKISKRVSKDIDLDYEVNGFNNAVIHYKSSNPERLSHDGRIFQDLNEDHSVIIYTFINYEGYKVAYSKEVMVEQVSPYVKMPIVKKYIEDYMKNVDLTDFSTKLPTRYEEYNLDLNWYDTSKEIVNSDGTFNKTVEPMKTVIICEIKIGILVEKINFEYYSVGMDKAEKEAYLDSYIKEIYTQDSYRYLPIINLKDLVIKQGIVDLNAPNRDGRKKPVPSTARLNLAGYTTIPNPQNVLWIVIHETGNQAAGSNAEMHNRFINSNPSTGVSWHYTVDDKEIYQHIPDDEIAYHAGDGTRENGNGNCNGIGIEMCINYDGDYELTLLHTAKLVAKLLVKYNLQMTSIQQHFFFNGKDCPAIMRKTGRWFEFLNMIKKEFHLLKIIESSTNILINVDNSNNVYISPIDVLRAGDDEVRVNIKIEINLQDLKKEYDFTVLLKK